MYTCPSHETAQLCKTVLRIRLVLIPQNTYFRSEAIQKFLLGYSSMPTTKTKQKKARKSRGLELFSDIENLVINLGERHSERDGSANRNSARRPESVTSDMFGNGEENLYLSRTEMRSDNNADPGQNSARSIGCRVSSTLGCLKR